MTHELASREGRDAHGHLTSDWVLGLADIILQAKGGDTIRVNTEFQAHLVRRALERNPETSTADIRIEVVCDMEVPME